MTLRQARAARYIYGSKESVIQTLQKYVDQPNVFIRFSDDNKLGINPRFAHQNIFGIYGYPLTSSVFHDFAEGKLSFARNRKYIIIFEITPPPKSLDDLTDADIEKIIQADSSGYLKDVRSSPGAPGEQFLQLLLRLTPLAAAKLLDKAGFTGLVDIGHHWLSPVEEGHTVDEGFAVSGKYVKMIEVLENASPGRTENVLRYLQRANPEKYLEKLGPHLDDESTEAVFNSPQIPAAIKAKILKMVFDGVVPGLQLSGPEVAAWILDKHPEVLTHVTDNRLVEAADNYFASNRIHPSVPLRQILNHLVKTNSVGAILKLMASNGFHYVRKILADWIIKHPDRIKEDPRWRTIVRKLSSSMQNDEMDISGLEPFLAETRPGGFKPP